MISARGPGGGYLLGKAIQEISVSDVIRAVDENVDATRCAGKQNCQGEDRCLTHDLWEELSEQITNFLSGISLSDLIQRRTVKLVSQRQDSIRLHLVQ